MEAQMYAKTRPTARKWQKICAKRADQRASDDVVERMKGNFELAATARWSENSEPRCVTGKTMRLS